MAFGLSILANFNNFYSGTSHVQAKLVTYYLYLNAVSVPAIPALLIPLLEPDRQVLVAIEPLGHATLIQLIPQNWAQRSLASWSFHLCIRCHIAVYPPLLHATY